MMKSLEKITINPIGNKELRVELQQLVDLKTKPPGSLGRLEDIAIQIGLIQQKTKIELIKPIMLTVASDHHICEEGVSGSVPEVTWQQVYNFLDGGGAIGLFCSLCGIELKVVDAGVDKDLEPHPQLVDLKVRKGTRNFKNEPAMTMAECNQAVANGRKLIQEIATTGTNVVGFGEMGIGNTTPATALLSIICNLKLEECAGPGCGLDTVGVQHKATVIAQAFEKHGISDNVEENLARFGGLEIATMVGAMLEAAVQRMVILVDGFITTSAFLVAYEINPLVKEYALFAHKSKEQGHVKMLEYMDVDALLDLELRLGEGTGVALAYPIIQASVAMINEMTSFEAAKVHNVNS